MTDLFDGLVEPSGDPVLGDPDAVQVFQLRRRTPVERAVRLAEERARLVVEGRPTYVVDVAERVMHETDQELARRISDRVQIVLSGWLHDNQAALFDMPAGTMQRMVAEVVIGFLVGVGLVREPDPGEAVVGIGDWRSVVPEHLRPDVDLEAEVARSLRRERHGRAVARRGPGEPLGEWPSLNPRRFPSAVDRKE